MFNERSGDLRSVTWANKGWRGDRWNSLGLLGHYVHLPIIELKVANRIILDICDILFIHQASTIYFFAQNRVGINNTSISKNICRDELTDGWKKAFDTNGNVEACSSQGLARRIKRNWCVSTFSTFLFIGELGMANCPCGGVALIFVCAILYISAFLFFSNCTYIFFV